MKKTYDESRQFWSSRVDTFKASGLTQAQFCKNNGYKVKQFNYWLRKFRELNNGSNNNEMKWIPVSVEDPRVSKLNIRIGSAVIEVESGFDAKLLTEVIKTLGAVC